MRVLRGINLYPDVNERALKFIQAREGWSAKVYKDSAGYPTIGYGHLIKPGERFSTITRAEGDVLMRADLDEAEGAVTRLVKVKLTDDQYGALVSFTYNLGQSALATSTLLKKLNAGNYAAVPAEMLKWVNAGGRRIEGLVTRRKLEGALWRGEFKTVSHDGLRAAVRQEVLRMAA